MTKAKIETEEIVRERSRTKTADTLKLALKELIAADKDISISAVAKLAGVTPALVHNKYPDIAEKIRNQLGKSTRAQRDEKHFQLNEAQTTIKTLRDEKKALLAEVVKLASINESLRRQLKEALAIANSKNVVPLRSV